MACVDACAPGVDTPLQRMRFGDGRKKEHPLYICVLSDVCLYASVWGVISTKRSSEPRYRECHASNTSRKLHIQSRSSPPSSLPNGKQLLADRCGCSKFACSRRGPAHPVSTPITSLALFRVSNAIFQSSKFSPRDKLAAAFISARRGTCLTS